MKEGKILACHCDCMAGFGESCSHVASLLWVVASGVQHRDSKTVTDKSWDMPVGVKKVPYEEIKYMSFIGKKRKNRSCSSKQVQVNCKQPKKMIDNATKDEEFHQACHFICHSRVF